MGEPQDQMRAVLARLAQLRQGAAHRYTLPFPEARAQLHREREPWLADGPACVSQDTELITPSRRVGLRITRPTEPRSGHLLVYLHGGGWCVGSPHTHDNIVRRLATGMGCEVWSVDYALAPEAAFPQGLLDVMSVVTHARQLHPDGHITLAGDSAGANLALAATLMELHRAQSTSANALMLFYGVYAEGFEDPSMEAFGDGRFGLSVQAQRRYLEAYLGSAPHASMERACSFPLTSSLSLTGLPPVWMTVAELDILSDQNRAMAHQLQRANVAVQVDEIHGVTHGFLSYGLMLDAAVQALADAAAWARSLTALPSEGRPMGS